MSRKRSGGRSGDGFRRTLGPGLHQRSRFHAVALGMSHAELVRRAVDNFCRQPVPAQEAMNRKTAEVRQAEALDRVVCRSMTEKTTAELRATSPNWPEGHSDAADVVGART